MKYNDEEFEAEILKRSGWTKEELSNYLHRKVKESDPMFDDEDVDIFIRKLKEWKDGT